MKTSSRSSLLPSARRTPLSFSLSRCRSALAVGAVLALASSPAPAATVTWDNDALDFLWTNPMNWVGNVLPTAADDLVFGLNAPGTIQLVNNQTENSLTFNQNFTLGAYGTNLTLTNTSGSVTVAPSVLATINASYAGSAGITLRGGGTLFLNHPSPRFAGDIVVDGAGTTLLHRQEGPQPQYNGVFASQEFGRNDQVTLGFTTATRTITLTNGGEYRIINAGNNAEGGGKNIVIGTGGGALNLAAGYILQSLDDVGQLSSAAGNTFTKQGPGRLIIAGALANANPLAGPVVIDEGMLSLDTITAPRFNGITTANTLTINDNGVILLNNGTAAALDTATVIANDGAILAVQGQDHQFGLPTGGSTLTINGTVRILTRDLFGVQTQRFPRLHSELRGSGILEIRGNTNAGGTPRLVIQRSTPTATFDGIYRLTENASLEANPRNNTVASGGTGVDPNSGKLLVNGDIEFAGWGGTLDVRDSTVATSVFNYTTNEVTVTTTQAGNLNFISPIRGDTAAGTGHLFNFGTLTMGNHRIGIGGNNSYQTGFADTARILGNAVFEMRADNSFLVFSNAVAISEDAAGRSLTLIKTGVGNTGARDVIVGGGISISNLEVATGTLQLRGADGEIIPAFGGAAPIVTVNGSGLPGNGNTLPTQGLLHLDSNTGLVVGATTVIAAANNSDRIVDSAILNMRSNSILRLTSASAAQTTETIGTTNVFGHATFDVVKTGAAPAPVALTLSTLTMGANATANFTGGATLGTAVADSTRIVIPGTAAGFMGSRFHVANEWAKYDPTLNNGFELGVTPFLAGDYVATFTPGLHTRLAAAPAAFVANTQTGTLNLQMPANAAVNTGGFILSLDLGGLLASGNLQGVIGNAGVGGLTAGTTAPASLFAHTNATNAPSLEIHIPIIDNLGTDLAPGGGDDSAVTFVKSGTGILVLSHHGRTVGQAQLGAILPGPTWSSTNTGGWVINDGMLNVHRGQFLGATPTTVTLNGGSLEINEPGASDSVIPGWGHNIVVNGNAMIGSDDNGEVSDAAGGDRTLVRLGSLTINNNSILGFGGFSDNDIAFMGGATINGKATLNIATSRSGGHATILSGVLAGTGGFDLVTFGATAGTLVLGGTVSDTANNTYDGALTLYGGTLRVNKANGSTAITDGTAREDVVINGGSLFWGPGQFGDLATTNNVNTTNNGLGGGIAPTSPAPIMAAGMNQIADTATITLLTGTLGESDRITNERFGTLIHKNGTINVGLGTIEVDSATVSGGAMGFDRGGTFRVGTLSYLPGAPSQSIFTGLPTPTGFTSIEVGAGGISFTGQSLQIGNGFSGNVAGSGGRLLLGGNVNFVGSQLLGGSFGRQGIYIALGASFREVGGSHIDLAGGNRTFTIESDSLFTITPRIINGGITKAGGGALSLENYQPSTFAGPVSVLAGLLNAKADGAFGTSAGGVSVSSGGAVKLESGWVYGDDFTVSGPGAVIPGSVVPGSTGVIEPGALIAEGGFSRITGAFNIVGGATLAGNTFLDPSATPGANGLAYRIGTLRIESASGINGGGTLTLSGHGDGVILNGVNTAGGSGILKDGAGRWTIAGPSAFAGPATITAGALRMTNGLGLGSAVAGTTVLGGALEVAGGITSAEPLTLYGAGSSTQSGALVNVSGNNTWTGPITLGSATTLRSDSGRLSLATIAGTGTPLTLSGAGQGEFTGALNLSSVAGTDTLTKNGTGIWSISQPSTISGSTRVNGGTLLVLATGVLDPSSPLNMAGGGLAARTQTVNGLNLLAGGGDVSPFFGTLTVGPIARSAGATVDFGETVNTTTGNTNGILGGYATFEDEDWATVGAGGNLVAFSGYTPLPFGPSASVNNSRVTTGQAQTGAVTANSLKLESTSGAALGANTLTLTSGGVLYADVAGSLGGISGTGLISGPTPADELIIHTAGGIFDIGNPLIGAGAGSLTKAGDGTLFLRGTSAFTGSVNINRGTLSIVGPGGTAHPGQLGSSTGPRDININGGTFEVVGGDYDAGANTMQYNIGPAGGTVRASFGSIITINDGTTTGLTPTQLRGSGDLTFTGGGRYFLSGGTPQFTGFTGNTTVAGGILTVGHSNALGGRQEQTVTLKSGSAIINNTGFGLGQNGLPNNIVAEGGVEFFSLGGNRVFGGDIQLIGPNTIALFERDALSVQTQLYFNGRVSGSGITLEVFGANAGNPFYLTSGANDLTGRINLNANAVLEVRQPGSLGFNTGGVDVNLIGANSRLLLRHWQNADYRANVNVLHHAEINTDRLVNYGGGANQLLTINDLTVNSGADRILLFGGGSGYTTRVGGTANFASSTIVNTAGNVLFENGISFTGGANLLDKRGGGSIILRGPSDHAGPTIVQQGFLILQGATGSLPNTSSIQLRGGELRVENSDAINLNRLNDAAPISLGGGTLRITGVETLGTVTAASGTTIVVNNPISDSVPNPLTLTGFTRQLGAVVQFQQPDFGGATGSATFAQSRVSGRVLIPGQATTTQTIPGFLGNNSLDFVQYDTAADFGAPLGVRDMRNPGNVNSPQNYTDNPGEASFNDTIIARLTTAADATTTTTTLLGNRGIDAIKFEPGGTNRVREINVGAFQLRIDGGGIIAVAATTSTVNINGAGSLTAGPAVPGTNTAELFVGGNQNININAVIANNGTQPVALVKTGTATLNLGSPAANTYSGGTYVNSGTLNTTVNNAFGLTANSIFLAGGTFQFNIPNAATVGDLGVPDHAINVNANSLIILDNGALAGTDNDITLGPITINGPYTLGMRGFDSMDATFTGTHTLSGTPTLDMAQVGSGSNASFFTINGNITGSGFFVTSSGATDNTAGILQIGGGESVNNTFIGKLTTLLGSFSEDLRVELNKAAGFTAIPGDLEINGGIVRNLQNEQIADTSNIFINQGSYDGFGKNETVRSVTMRGGNFRTSSTASGGSTFTVLGDFEITGLDDLTGSSDGVATNSNTTLIVNGILKLNGFSRGTVGGTAANLIVGGLEMTGTTLFEGGAGSLIRLNGDVTTFPSANTARLGATTTAGAQVQLNGTRNFNIADGSAGIDLSASTALVDSTAPVAAGGLTKNGDGTLQLEGAGLVNAYSGPTTVNGGSLILFKSPGVNAVGNGGATNSLLIGDGLGGARADKLIIRESHQIADTTNVVIASSGLLDLQTFDKSEQIASLAGSGAVNLGSSSTLTVDGATSTTFSGTLAGPGNVTKAGASTLDLTGPNTFSGATVVNGGTLTATAADSLRNTSTVALNTGGTLLLGGTGGPSKINDIAAFTANGGTFNTGGIDGLDEQVGTLTLTLNSIIDFGAAPTANYLRFANSSLQTWTAATTLSIYNWSGIPVSGNGVDRLFFGTDPSGLMQSQLDQVSFFSGPGTGFLGTATFATSLNGEIVPVPEPSVFLAAMGLLGLAGWRERRQERERRRATRNARA